MKMDEKLLKIICGFLYYANHATMTNPDSKKYLKIARNNEEDILYLRSDGTIEINFMLIEEDIHDKISADSEYGVKFLKWIGEFIKQFIPVSSRLRIEYGNIQKPMNFHVYFACLEI